MKIIDLTMGISEKTPIFPGTPKPKIKQLTSLEKNGYNVNEFTLNTHFATHIDFPCHMVHSGKNSSDFPIEKFVGEAICIDVKGKKELKKDCLKNIEIKPDDMVLFYTGQTEKAYSDDFFKENPVITEELAEELVKKKISIVGMDSFTPDNHPYSVHKIFLKKDILILENLVNLDKVKNMRFNIFVLPLKLENIDGVQCRVIGIVK